MGKTPDLDCRHRGGAGESYRASIANMQPINPAEVIVNVQVTNTGSDSGTPACTVCVWSPRGAYTSDGVQTAHQPIPGSQTTLQGALPSPFKALTNVTPIASSVNCV